MLLGRNAGKPVFPLLAVVAGGLLLAGCSGKDLTRAFGIERSAPDEYTITTRAPLSMPPSDDLQAPREGALRPQDESPRLQALETLSPNVAIEGANGAESSGQQALVGQANMASTARPAQEFGQADHSFVNEVMFWNGNREGSVVDGEAENERLKRNSALGKSPLDGATPTQKDDDSSGFLDVF
ncbi:DUF3035 domain-containing protein [Entomobacter blattae]|nr:DUF3035 domain-containing protein [Entomobacter blattae]